MKGLFYLWIILMFASCHKQDDSVPKTTSVLMQNSWYVYQINTVSFNDSDNTILSDTTSIAEDCLQRSSFRFLKDSIFERSMYCAFTEPYAAKGKWYLSDDSMLVSNAIYNYLPSTGYTSADFGFGSCKVLEISVSQFVIRRTEWSYASNSTRYRRETTMLCKSKK